MSKTASARHTRRSQIEEARQVRHFSLELCVALLIFVLNLLLLAVPLVGLLFLPSAFGCAAWAAAASRRTAHGS